MNTSNMQYIINLILSSTLIWFLIGDISLVMAASSPSWRSRKLRLCEATGGAINVAGLDVLRTYICPPCANTIRRQIDTKRSATVTVAIPIGDISELWQELQWILEQLSVILEAEGLLPVSTPTANLPVTLTALLESTMQSTRLLSATPVVSNPSLTNPVVIATPATVTAMASPPVETASGITPKAKANLAGFTIGLSVGSSATVGVPGPMTAPSPSPGTAAMSQNPPESLNTTPPASGNLISQCPTCYTTDTINETTTVPLVAATVITTRSATNPPSEVVIPATSPSSVQPTTSTTPYTFNSQSTRNIAVYFGQSGSTGQTTLEAQCADPNIDIVILAFVITRNYEGKYPSVNFGAACGGQTLKMMAEAPGLLSCPELEGYIDTCQQTYGRKVLLSIGGSTSSLSFTSASDASDFANTLWQLFGPPGSLDMQFRPFGNASIDGFDVDNEDKLPSYFGDFASTLRQNYETDASKLYYLSSAPQCPFPDASDPLALLLLSDFVFVQFYNNPPCEIGSANFSTSLQQWSEALEASTQSPKPRMYLGAPAWSAAGPGAYARIGSPKGMQDIAKNVEDMQLVNFGGVMFWDGPEAMQNTEGGMDILGWTKAGLTQ